MESGQSELVPLVVHPSAAGRAGLCIRARAELRAPGSIGFRYRLEGDLARIRLAERKDPQRADRLWEHTCFEAFIRAPGVAGYHELNVAASRDWALFRFSAYRKPLALPHVEEPPKILARRLDDALEVDAAVRLRDLADLAGASALQIALCAVIEELDGTLSHWALRHRPEKADFHDPGGYAIELAVRRPVTTDP